MIALLLTLMCIFFIYVNSEDSTTVWVMIGIIALVWFVRMVWIDDAIAHINWVDHWVRNGRARTRYRRKAEVTELRDEETREEKDSRSITVQEVPKQKQEAKEPEAPKVACDRCGRWARVIHKTRYPSGKIYAEYQCPYCGDRKLKFIK